MNLLQVQDQLKSLPSDPRTMQALMAYANGANPAVPPYLALGELNRRKQLMEKAQMEQASQPPQGTVKDQVEQQAGIMALQQGQQQQAMQNAMRMGAAVPQGIPANIPQPQAQPVQAARGGLMALLAARANAKRMNSGGIVALAGGGTGEEENGDGEGTDDTEGKIDLSGVNLAEALAANKADRAMVQQLIAQMQKAKDPETPMQFRERMIKEKPEQYGHLAEAPDKGVQERFDAFQQAQREELAKRREEAQSQKPGILQLLGQAAMESRGQQGRSALASILGGYSKLQSGADASAIEREQALRAEELKMQQGKMELVNKLQELKRARDEGDIEKEQKAMVDIAKLAKDRGTTVANLVKGLVTSSGSLAGRLGSAAITAQAKRDAARMTGNKPPKPTDLDKVVEAHMNALVAEGADPADPQTRLAAVQRASRDLSKSAGSVRAETTQMEKANAQFENRLLMDKTLRQLRRTDPAAYEQRVEQVREEIKKEFGIRPDMTAPRAQVKPTPVEPQAAKPSAPPSISSVKGAPAGASIGNLVEGKGWEIKGKDGKLLGYAQ